MLFFFLVWLTTQKDFSTCRIWKRSLISQLLGDVFVNVGVCRSVNSISCLYAHVSVSVYWWKPDVCLCECVCRAGFSVRMCACMWLFVHTCPHVSCYRLSINVWEMCLHTCLAAAVFVCKRNGKLFVQKQIGWNCEWEWKIYSCSFFQTGVRKRDGWKRMEENCLQMIETEKEEVNVQCDKVKAMCFQNSC